MISLSPTDILCGVGAAFFALGALSDLSPIGRAETAARVAKLRAVQRENDAKFPLAKGGS